MPESSVEQSLSGHPSHSLHRADVALRRSISNDEGGNGSSVRFLDERLDLFFKETLEKRLAFHRTFYCIEISRLIVRDMAKHEPDLSLLFHALSDPTRRSILTRLAEGPASVKELADPTGLRLPTVMRHLSVLRDAGLIATSKDGRVRTCALMPEALTPVRTWLDEQRAIWDARLDRLEVYVNKLIQERPQ